MARLNDDEMRELLYQLTAKTSEGTIRWRAVGLHRLHAQYEDNVVEIGVTHGYRRSPPARWPIYYCLKLGRSGSVRSLGNGEQFVHPDLGLLYSYRDEWLKRGLSSPEGRTWRAMESLYWLACGQDARAENLRAWSRVEWGCFQGCLVTVAGVLSIASFVTVGTTQLW